MEIRQAGLLGARHRADATAAKLDARAQRQARHDQPKAAVYVGPGQPQTLSGSRPRPVRRKRFSGRKINIDIKDGDLTTSFGCSLRERQHRNQ